MSSPAGSSNGPRIGILQFIPQLEDAVWGFLGSLETELGRRPEVVLHEAGGDEERCLELARRLVKADCDLLFGCLTPAARALQKAAAPRRTPVIFAPVFHPVLAGLIDQEQSPGGWTTGVTGRLDPTQKVETISLLFSKLDEVTVLIDPKDSLCRWEAGQLATAFLAKGVQTRVEIVADATPLPAPAGQVHVLPFAPALEETMDQWIEAFHRARTPVVASSARAGFQGAVMAVFSDHGALGEIAGKMAAEVLRGADPGKMPVRHPPGPQFGFSYGAAGRLGICIPVPLGQRGDIF